ncbi:MAG TPA: hypothetical protein PKX91_05505 [Clostridia bacterium]|jgi:hypothetical protein|nr:hypothetical protein [Clostridia bacterium]
MARKKIKKNAVIRDNGYDPYVPSDIKAGMRKKREPTPIKPIIDYIPTKKWVLYLLVTLIPVINFCALIAWASNKNVSVNPNIKTYAKAALITTLIVYILAAALVIIFKFALHLF